MQEIWKDVVGYEGIYKVSNMGNLMSLPRKWTSANGAVRHHNGKIINSKGRGRYPKVILCRDGIIKHRNIHQLVAEAFLGYDKSSGLIIDHKNNVSTDNRLENLQLVTVRQNIVKDKKKKSLLPTGVSKLTSGRFRSCCRLNGQRIDLGVFNCPTLASFAYQKAIR